MNLDDNTLTLLAVQMIVLSLVGSLILLFRSSAATRVWCIRVTVLSLIGLAFASQLPMTQVLPAQRIFMIPAQIDPVTAVNRNFEKLAPAPKDRQISTSALRVSALEIWSAGVAFGLMWIAFAWQGLRRLRKRSRHFGERCGVEFRISPDARSPLVAGFVSPTLYLPAHLPELLSPAELEVVFIHELAHIEHRDLRWKALHRLTCLLLWPNVVLWLLTSPHDRAMEELADAKASLAAATPKQYAAFLIAMAKQRKGKDRTFSLAMMPKRSNIGRRVRKILGGNSARELTLIGSWARVVIGLFVLSALALVVAGFGWQHSSNGVKENPWRRLSGELAVHILASDGGPAVEPQAWLHLQGNIEEHVEPVAVKQGWLHIDRSKYASFEGVQIIAKDAAGAVGAMPVENGAQTGDLVLQPTAVVKGQCVLANGQPAVGVDISPLYALKPLPHGAFLFPLSGLPGFKTATDLRGYFSLMGIPRNTILRFTVADPSVQQPRRSIASGGVTHFGFEVGGGQSSDLGRIVLQPAGQVSGRVAHDGRGIAGIRVIAQQIRDGFNDEAEGSEAITDADGQYRIVGLGNASYNLEVYLPEDLKSQCACAAIEAVRVERGLEVAHQDFAMSSGGLIEGQVILRSHADAEGYPVAYYNPDHPQSAAACGGTRCDAKGNFSIRVSPGDQFVYMQGAGQDGDASGQHISVASGQTVHITLRE